MKEKKKHLFFSFEFVCVCVFSNSPHFGRHDAIFHHEHHHGRRAPTTVSLLRRAHVAQSCHDVQRGESTLLQRKAPHSDAEGKAACTPS